MEDIFDVEMSPVFEAYGKACYAGQMLESIFRFLLILNVSRSSNELISIDAIKSIKEETKKDTLNKIFKKAQKREYFTETEIRILIQANQDRNFIINNFWDKEDNIKNH